MILSANTILITGGTSGIGLAFAKEFYELGNTVIVCGRREDRLKEISTHFPGIITKICDVSIEQARKDLAAWIIAEYPATNIVMNNAGVQYAFDLHQEINTAKLNNEVNTNLIAPIHLSSLFVNHLQTKNNGAIINISSGLSFVPIAFMPVYCATKAAIHSFTLSLRYQLKNTSIKVFEIAPPAVDTELGHDRRSNKDELHGGLAVDLFLKEAMEALQNDTLEAPIAQAKGLREKGEGMFEMMNGRFA